MSVSASGEFGTVLREWRNRRRLSQIDLAIEAGTTQRHLSFLEQGRSAPGRDIVSRLAGSLQLTLRQRNMLLSAAGFAPAHPEAPPDAPLLQPSWMASVSWSPPTARRWVAAGGPDQRIAGRAASGRHGGTHSESRRLAPPHFARLARAWSASGYRRADR